MNEGYKIVLRDGYPFVETITYETENENGTTTPIDLRTKRLILKLIARSGFGALTLDTNAPATPLGSSIEILEPALPAAATGRFRFTITAAEVAAQSSNWGRATLELIGENEPLFNVPYSWK